MAPPALMVKRPSAALTELSKRLIAFVPLDAIVIVPVPVLVTVSVSFAPARRLITPPAELIVSVVPLPPATTLAPAATSTEPA